MKKSKFNKLVKEISESITTDTAGVGATQPTTQSGDFYAPGDSRVPKVLGAKKGKKIPIQRRPPPAAL